MAVEFINDAVDIDIGVKVQTVDAETFEQSVFPRLLNTGAPPAYPSNEVASEDTGDNGGSTGRRRIAKGGDLDLPMHFRYGANKVPEAGAFRDTWASEVTYTGTGVLGDVAYVLAGTHADATPGLQIQLPLGSLTALKLGVGRGLLVLNELWADAGNNQPFMVKEVHDDGAKDLVDLYDAYGGGSVTDPMGAPKTAADSQGAVLHFGEWIRNRRCTPASKQVFSVMVDHFCLTGPRKYRGLLGWVPNDFTLEIPDEGAVRCTVTGMGRRWLQSQATPPNGEAEGSHFTDPTARDFLVGGEDMEFLTLATFPNAQVATAVPIILSDRNVTNWSFTLAGGVESLSNVLGMAGVLPKRGKFEATGTLGYYVADDLVMGQLEDLGSSAFHQKAAMHVVFKDPDGNWKGLTLPRNEFGQTGGEGGTGAESGTLEFGCEAIDPFFRTAILQQWSPFA